MSGDVTPPASGHTASGGGSLGDEQTCEAQYWERRRRSATVPMVVGLMGLATLGTAHQWPLRHALENDLTDRSLKSLGEAGLDGVRVDFTGRDAVLHRDAGSGADLDRAVSLVAGQEGVRVAEAQTPTPTSTPSPSASPKHEQVLNMRLRDGSVTLSGTVATEAIRSTIVDQAVTALGQGRVADRIRVDAATDSDRTDGIALLLASLGRNCDVTVVVQPDSLQLEGTVVSQSARKIALTAAGMVAGDPSKVVSDLIVASEELEVALSKLPRIGFATDGTRLSVAGEQTVHTLAELLKLYPTAKIQIRGYTDSRGPADMNYALSYDRARTVRLALERYGIERFRMTAMAFGEKDPMVPNTSRENMALNRRVEIGLVP
jgi:outer membrane protein OmpA-like peptidoglycan-associated protein